MRVRCLLLAHQPVERFIKLLLVNAPEPEHLAKRGSRGVIGEPTCGRQLGGRIDEPRHDHRDAQRYFATGLHTALGQNPIEPDLAQRAESRCHMTVRQAAQQR